MVRAVLALIFILLWVGCVQNTPSTTNTDSQPLPEVPDEVTPPQTGGETPIVEEEIPAEEVPRLPEEEVEAPPEEETVSFAQPTLTYANAYNGPLIDTVSQISGADVDIDLYMENNNRNGVHAFIGYFGYTGNYPPELFNTHTGPGYMIDALQRYPGRVIPYVTLGYGAEESIPYVENFTEYYEDTYAVSSLLGPGVISGIGEIEMYGLNVTPNSADLRPLFDWAAENNLHIMFHPNEDEVDSIRQLVERYPATKFIMHQFPEDFSSDRSELIELMKTHPNLYFSVDSDHMMYDGEIGLLYKYQFVPVEVGAKKFNEDFDSEYKALLQTALNRYRPLIEAVPDQVMWGTELGVRYGHEPASYDRIIRFAREFIGKLKPEHQEKFAYLNAWNTFGPAPKVTTSFTVQDTSSWPACTQAQDDKCFNQCADEFPDFKPSWEDTSPPDFEACWDMCTIALKCEIELDYEE